MLTPVPAAQVYRAQGEDRSTSALRRGLNWVGTAVVTMLETPGFAPAMTDVVIRLIDDGSEVQRLRPSDLDDVRATLELVRRDLETLDAVDFADAWLD